MPNPRDFRGSRLALASTLLDGSKTASAIAHALDKPTGSIFGLLTRMVAEELLVADTGSPTRGTRYSLLPAARQVLKEMERDPMRPGTISVGQRLLLIEPPAALTPVQRVLAEDWVAGFIDWAVEGGGGWLLGVRTEDSYPLQRLRMALEGAGAVSRELPAEAVLSGDELTARAVWLLEDVEQSR